MFRYMTGVLAPKRPEKLARKVMIKDKRERGGGRIFTIKRRERKHNVNVYFRTSKSSIGLVKVRF